MKSPVLSLFFDRIGQSAEEDRLHITVRMMKFITVMIATTKPINKNYKQSLWREVKIEWINLNAVNFQIKKIFTDS